MSARDESAPSRDGRKKPGFGRPTVRDVIAGLVTGLFSIPEGMAYATVGGFAAPLGLWSGAVPTIIGSFFSRTVLMVTTLTSAIVLTANSVLADAGLDPGDLGAIATMTVMTGAWMALLGLLRLGAVMSFVSTAVMTGFTAGIALQIIAGVLKDATGYEPETHNTIGKFIENIAHVGEWDLTTVLVSMATVAVWAVLVFFKPLRKAATLFALLAVTVVVAAAGVHVETVSDIAAIPRSLPPVTLPDLATLPVLAAGSFAIALVALAQASGIGAAVPNPDGSRTDISKDFVAQGAANIAGGFFGALPVGGSLSRTGVATSSGARTRWAGIFSGVWLILIVVLVGPLAGLIPMPVIGGLLLVIGGELIKGRLYDIKLVLRTSLLSSVAMIVTFAATTQLPLQQAIFIGAGLSIVLFAVQVARRGRILELVPTGSGDFTMEPSPDELPSDKTTVLHYAGTGFFAEVNRLQEEWPRTLNTHNAGLVVSLRGTAGIPSTTFLESLDKLIGRWHDAGIEVVLAGVPAELRKNLDRIGITEHLRGAIVDDAGGVLGAVEEAFRIAESRRLERRDSPPADEA